MFNIYKNLNIWSKYVHQVDIFWLYVHLYPKYGHGFKICPYKATYYATCSNFRKN